MSGSWWWDPWNGSQTNLSLTHWILFLSCDVFFIILWCMARSSFWGTISMFSNYLILVHSKRFGWDPIQGSHQQDPLTNWVLSKYISSRVVYFYLKYYELFFYSKSRSPITDYEGISLIKIHSLTGFCFNLWWVFFNIFLVELFIFI